MEHLAPLRSRTPLLWSYGSALVGAVVWLLLPRMPYLDELLNSVARLFLLAVLVVVPLSFPLLEAREWDGHLPLAYLLALICQPFASLLVLFSFRFPPGPLAALLASAWLVVTLFLALYGLSRLIPKGRHTSLPLLSASVGLMFVPVGAGWLLTSRLGLNPLGFSSALILLTAVHFHYAGMLLPLLVGLVGERLHRISTRPWHRRAYRVTVAGVLLGTPLVALGITFSPLIETAGVLVLALSVILFALLASYVARTLRLLPQTLLHVSALLLLLPMVLAVAYTIGNLTGRYSITLPRMVAWHGWSNALAIIMGLLSWTLARPARSILMGRGTARDRQAESPESIHR